MNDILRYCSCTFRLYVIDVIDSCNLCKHKIDGFRAFYLFTGIHQLFIL